MSLFNRMWAWLTRIAPEEVEETLLAEQVLLEARLKEIETSLAVANVRRLLKQVEEMRAKLHVARATPPNQRELDIVKKYLAKKEDCNHLKGGYMLPINAGVALWDKFRGGRGESKDYNLGTHTYPDGRTEIKCLTCKQVWTKDSPDWKMAVEMMRSSSNKPSSSEVQPGWFK